MKISRKGIDLIKSWEGCVDGNPSTVELDPYICPAGKPTIGWGHLIQDHEDFSEGITIHQAKLLLNSDVKGFESAVIRLTPRDLSQCQFDALVSFTYNVGITAYEKSTLRAWIMADDRDLKCPQQFTRWVNSNGKPFKGLALRRLDESKMWLNGC